MKKIIVILTLLMACKPSKDTVESFYLSQSVSNCTLEQEERIRRENFAMYTRTFEICMKGQRNQTGTDDADDFVKECHHAAESHERVCTKTRKSVLYYFIRPAYEDWCQNTYSDSSYNSKCIECSNAATESHKKLCADAGFKETK